MIMKVGRVILYEPEVPYKVKSTLVNSLHCPNVIFRYVSNSSPFSSGERLGFIEFQDAKFTKNEDFLFIKEMLFFKGR